MFIIKILLTKISSDCGCDWLADCSVTAYQKSRSDPRYSLKFNLKRIGLIVFSGQRETLKFR